MAKVRLEKVISGWIKPGSNKNSYYRTLLLECGHTISHGSAKKSVPTRKVCNRCADGYFPRRPWQKLKPQFDIPQFSRVPGSVDAIWYAALLDLPDGRRPTYSELTEAFKRHTGD